ncbi:unnamed protein product [Owenia fusiformis]|uniref:Uncharacterized protein n=1 Tax=Owenia fusiformis TaxID=6347 RepID=A0A8J1Y073_OWEFU|nr:unnamed protein product [Owenia fusiformis]
MKKHVLFFCTLFTPFLLVLLIHIHWLMQGCSGSSTGGMADLTWREAELLFKTFVPKERYNCKNIVKVGRTPEKRNGEGIYPTCMDETYEVKVPCIVYAFGIAGQWEFEDDFARRGCQVFAFDPSMNTDSHKRADNIWFYNIGIGTIDTDTFTPRVDNYVKKSKLFTWKVRTMESIMKMLGHTNSTIDVLKMDVESYEFDILSRMMEDGTLKQVRQVLSEWHIFGDQKYDYPTKYSIAKQFWKYGFQAFSVVEHDPNYPSTICKQYCFQIDFGFVNTKYK